MEILKVTQIFNLFSVCYLQVRKLKVLT